MADNTTLNAGSGGDVIRDVAKSVNSGTGAKTQLVVPDIGGGAAGSPEIPWQTVQGDAQAASAGIPPDAPMLFNGTTYDRWREGAATGAGLVSPVDNTTGSYVVNATSCSNGNGTGVLTGFPLSTAGFGKMIVFIAASTLTGTLVWEGSNDGFVTSTPLFAGQIGQNYFSFAPAYQVSSPVAGAMYEVPLSHAAVRIRSSVFGGGAATVQWNLKASGNLYKAAVDQGSPNVNAAAWPFRLTDTTNAAVIKPASTPPAASDPALVVVVSPNSSLIDNSVGVSSPTNVGGYGAGVVGTLIGPISASGLQSLIVACTTTGGGTIAFLGSNDNWATSFSLQAFVVSSTGTPPASSFLNPAAGTVYEVPTKAAQIKVTTTGASGYFSWILKSGNPAHFAVDAARLTASTNSSGLTSLAIVSAATNNLTTVKAGTGQLYMADFCNNSAGWVYLKLFNGSPTMGSTNALCSYGIPPGGSKTLSFGDLGLQFAAGLFAAITNLPALNDNTAITAGIVTGTFHYA